MKFTIRTIINASAKDIYTTWLSSKGHALMTGGDAIASNKVGDVFSAWDGYISGKNLELQENKRIVQSWRTTEFNDEEADSKIEIVLSENNGTTKIVLHHTQLTAHGEQYKSGWVEHYFEPMKMYFETK